MTVLPKEVRELTQSNAVVESTDSMRRSIVLIRVNNLVPEVMNRVYFLLNPNAVIFVIDPTMAEFSRTSLMILLLLHRFSPSIDYSTWSTLLNSADFECLPVSPWVDSSRDWVRPMLSTSRYLRNFVNQSKSRRRIYLMGEMSGHFLSYLIWINISPGRRSRRGFYRWCCIPCWSNAQM